MRDKMKAVTRAHTRDRRLIDLVLFSNISGDFSLWFLGLMNHILVAKQRNMKHKHGINTAALCASTQPGSQ